jgi:hypothetical protein
MEERSMETTMKAPYADGTNTMTNASHSEGSVAKAIESQTAKLPSDLFLWAAFGSMAGSLALQMMGKKEQSNFVGQWAPTLLILGSVQQDRKGGWFRLARRPAGGDHEMPG